ncbi:MAG TPA: carbohydrate ABC transporter permease [Gaiellaceae bacterium]|nr:carbohydrate ABC transporter permease [Gaiellaceae bacterium]
MQVTKRLRRGARGPAAGPAGGRARVGALLGALYILLFLVFLLFPIYWVILTSFKPTDEFQTIPPVFWTHHPTTLHYATVMNHLRGWLGLKNSLIVASLTTVFSLLIGTSAAYSMARFRTGGRHLPFFILSQRFMPPIAVAIPIFLLYSNQLPSWTGLRLYDTQAGLIILYTMFTLPFSAWMMYTYFKQMPVELEEAALVDGCSRWQALWRVAAPLAAPGLVSAAAFAFIFAWTDFFFALLLTSTKATTLPVVVSQFLSFQSAEFGESSALTVVAMIPALVLGLIVQRHLVRGLTLGAVRG